MLRLKRPLFISKQVDTGLTSEIESAPDPVEPSNNIKIVLVNTRSLKDLKQEVGQFSNKLGIDSQVLSFLAYKEQKSNKSAAIIHQAKRNRFRIRAIEKIVEE